MGRRIAAVAVFLFACASGPHAPPAPPRHTNLGLAISRATLPNGLRVAILRDPRATEAQVTMRYQVGSVDDPAGGEGTAHLVEHLMFQQVLGERTIFARLEDDATYFNGMTTLDATTYVARAAPEHLDELLAIESVRLGLRCTSITDAAFERERAVVVNEVKLRAPALDYFAAVDAAVYPEGHPYRARSGAGEQAVGTVTREQACAFADAHYTPGNAVLVVSGAIDPERVEATLARLFTHLPARAVAVRPPLPPIANTARAVTARAPIDDDALLVAWPLPQDPRLRSKIRALAAMAYALVDGSVRGRVDLVALGDVRSPALGLLVRPSTSETFAQVRERTKRALDATPLVFTATGFARLDRYLYEVTKQQAIAGVFDTLEDGSGRDERLAEYVLENRDPNEALEAELRGLRDMSREDASAIARDFLAFDRATVVTLQHTNEKKRGEQPPLARPNDDWRQHRAVADPALAHAPLAGDIDRHGVSAMRTRQLANGLRVVLMPLTSVPTIDVRLVIGAGTADERADARGSALLAANALTWDPADAEDFVLFNAAGGRIGIDVASDRTSFRASGLDMHVDLLLTGVARFVRDGRYDLGAEAAASAMHRQAKRLADSGALTDAWRVARYGAHHPYVDAGLVRHASASLGVSDAARFRGEHYAPSNATLVVAGHFDVALADRWIDFLFASWSGTAAARSSPRPEPAPASLAVADDTTQLFVSISLPATAGTHASQLVAAEMMSEVAGDVRQELGASYAFDAGLDESRLATAYTLGGAVDPARAGDALALVRDRLAALRSDPDAAARAFVSARQRVATRLVSLVGAASGLAARAEHDVELGRAPLADLDTAAEVKQLTIEAMAPALAELELARAVVLARGPEADVRRAFAVLGREPQFLSNDPPKPASRFAEDDDDSFEDLRDTAPAAAARSQVSIAVAPGITWASVAGHRASGFTVVADLGYRRDEHLAFGFHIAGGSVSGEYPVGALTQDFSDNPLDLAAYVRATAYDHLWGELALGMHGDFVSGGSAYLGGFGLGFTLQAGLDLWKDGEHHAGVYGRYDNEIGSDTAYEAGTFGLAYRR